MKFTETYSYDVDFASAWEMYADEGFARARAEQAGLSEIQVEVQQNAGELTFTISADVPTELLPTAASKFVSGNLKVTLTETWQLEGAAATSGNAAEASEAAGTFSLEVQGAPVKASATCTLEATSPTQTTRTMDGDLKVSIPMVGKMIESQAIKLTARIAAADQEAAATWLQNRR